MAFRLVALTALAMLSTGSAAAGAELDLAGLASCISDSGAIFYGAHWCPVCRKQKEHFDGYSYLLPYVECYDGDKSDGTNDRCKNEGIESFPTWKFPDGSVKTGAQTPEALAVATGCPLEEQGDSTRRGGSDAAPDGSDAAPDRGY
jgi:hypothetical protein